MSKSFLPTFTRLHKSFSTAGIFLAEPACAATPRTFGKPGESTSSTYNISLPLGPVEQALYFVVSGLAMKADTTIAPGTPSMISNLIGEMMFRNESFTVETGATPLPAIDITYAELARCIRYKGHPVDAMMQIQTSLSNLAGTTRSDVGTSLPCTTQLAQHMALPWADGGLPVEPEALLSTFKLRIALDPWSRLAMKEVKEAVTIDLNDYFALPSGPTRLLFAKLTATIRPGKSWPHKLTSLVNSIWGAEQTVAEVKSRVVLIEKSLSAMTKIGWRFEMKGDVAKVTRPAKGAP